MKYIKYLSIVLIFISCNIRKQRISLVNTKWEYRFEDFCISYITFKTNNIYEEYSCELDYIFSGKYHVKNDTIYLVQIDFASDIMSKNNPKVIKGKSFYLFKKNYLQYVKWEYYDWKTKKWTGNYIFPDAEVIYKKVTQN